MINKSERDTIQLNKYWMLKRFGPRYYSAKTTPEGRAMKTHRDWAYHRMLDAPHGFMDLSCRLYAYCVIHRMLELGRTVTPVRLVVTKF